MYAKVILNIILALITAVIQISFISALAGSLNNLNLVIIVLIFIISLSSFYYAWWWAIGIGTVLSVFSFLPFGVEIISLGLTVLFARLLLVKIFTNRSLYSFLLLTFFSLLAYKFLLLSLVSLIYLASEIEINISLNSRFWREEFYAMIVNLGAVIIGFYLVNLLSKSLKPVFLFRGK